MNHISLVIEGTTVKVSQYKVVTRELNFSCWVCKDSGLLGLQDQHGAEWGFRCRCQMGKRFMLPDVPLSTFETLQNESLPF